MAWLRLAIRGRKKRDKRCAGFSVDIEISVEGFSAIKSELVHLFGQHDFVGDWRIERRIHDRMLNHEVRFTGLARFTDQGFNTLGYVETGELFIPDQKSITATREYRWSFVEGEVFVSYSDGSPFHSFHPSSESWGARHLCGPDVYDVKYDFRKWRKWTMTWEVKGPRKDYRSISVFDAHS